MVDVALRFKTPQNLLFFLVIFVAASIWFHIGFAQKKRLNLYPFILLNGVFMAVFALFSNLCHDEAEYLHKAWLFAQGSVPFQGFWDNHSPFFYIICLPILKLLPPGVYLFDLLRILSFSILLINACIGWLIVKKAWQERADLQLYLLLLSSAAVTAEFLTIRPDLFMLFFLLSGLYFSLNITENKLSACFFAGICLAFAESVSFKQYLMVFLPFIAIFLSDRRTCLKKIIFYLFGLAIGSLGLLSYLISKGIISDFYKWVVNFNSKIVAFSVYLPICFILFAVYGAISLFLRWKSSRDAKPLILLSALCLSTINSLTTTVTLHGRYYLLFWFFVVALTGATGEITDAVYKMPSRAYRSILVSLVISSLIVLSKANMPYLRYSEDKFVSNELLRFCKGEKCFLLLPHHPIFAYDATRLVSTWQFSNCATFDELKNDIKSEGLAGKIITQAPAVILARDENREITSELFQRTLIAAGEYKLLNSFIREHYTLKRIGKGAYFIRNDKLDDIKTQ